MKKILVIGSANADFLNMVERMPKLGETVASTGFSVNSGGKGLNQAVAVSKLGGDVTFIGSLGGDSYGKMLIDTLKKNRIPFEGIVSDSVSTGIAVVTVVNGDNFIILHQGANELLRPETIESKAEIIKQADYILLQLEIPMETVIRTAEIAKAFGKTVILNPAPCKTLPEHFYRFIDMLIPNEHEAEQLTGISVSEESGCAAAIALLREKGVSNVIITRGEKGCAYNENERIIFCPPEKTVAVDTTSAGDSFIGGLCCKLALGDNLSKAVKYATKVAAITVSRSGAAISIPYADEIDG